MVREVLCMQVSVESTGNIQRTLTITVPADQIDGEIESRLKSMRGRVKIDGFPFTLSLRSLQWKA